ncbi:MFS transporter [Lagierella sp.]|uniref:MFS transporter n=1 Tax=Lagierella sp. TaxID=2849657 RepID=UPI002632B60F|nr:MFS transporter [Lagierella sp.]
MNSQPVIALTKRQKVSVSIGSIFLIFSLAMFGLSLNTLQGPMLEQIDAMSYFSLVSLVSLLGLTIMTPIGGKLGDLIGRRNLVLFSGVTSIVCGIGIGFANTLVPFILFRFLLGTAIGAFVSAPYILAREIHEPDDVPKMMGLLSSGMAVGGLLGSVIAGALMDFGFLRLAVTFPVIPLIIGVILITFNLPNNKANKKVKLDIAGIALMTISLSLILIALNYAPKYGFKDIKILGGLIIGIIIAILFVKVEKKVEEPLVPLRLLKNRNYVILLCIGFICYFYLNAMNIYAPLVTINVLGKPKSVAGLLQLPRTIITVILPVLAGAWVAKKKSNHKIAMILATALVAVPMFIMSFTSKDTNIILYMIMLGITGIAESFRAVSITTVAQTCLEPKDLGIGTSLVNFINTSASLVSASIFGIAYDLKTRTNPNDIRNILAGSNSVYLIAAIVSLIGLLIVLFRTKGIFQENEN